MASPLGPRRPVTRRPPILSGAPRGSSHTIRGIPGYIWMPAAGLTATLVYSYYAFIEEVPISKRKRWIATTPEYERQLGDQEYQQLLKQFRSQVLPPSHPAAKTVKRVGQRIATASEIFAKDHPETYVSPAPYTYTVVQSDQANAFVLPNNHVFVLTGLFKYVKDEDELAAVMGHEAAHNLARHAGERVSGNLVVNIFARLMLLVDPTGVLSTLFVPAAKLFHDLPNSREAEGEADRIGIDLAARACYDPRAAERVFRAMKEGSGGSAPEFLSTHPSHDARITKFEEWMPQAMEIYNTDNGERCYHVRRDMAQARYKAAQDAMAGRY